MKTITKKILKKLDAKSLDRVLIISRDKYEQSPFCFSVCTEETILIVECKYHIDWFLKFYDFNTNILKVNKKMQPIEEIKIKQLIIV